LPPTLDELPYKAFAGSPLSARAKVKKNENKFGFEDSIFSLAFLFIAVGFSLAFLFIAVGFSLAFLFIAVGFSLAFLFIAVGFSQRIEIMFKCYL
jgi:hypothetical protein